MVARRYGVVSRFRCEIGLIMNQAPFRNALRKASFTTLRWCILRRVLLYAPPDLILTNRCSIGDLVAIHRKVHLFDIDIPGKITFKASAFLFLL